MTYPQYRPDSDHRPLSDAELTELDDLLTNLPTDAAMNIEALDGYLAGLLLAPTPLAEWPGDAWLPTVWGGDGSPDPKPFTSGKQRKKLIVLVLRHLQATAHIWATRPEAWEPIFSVAEVAGEEEDEVVEFTDAEDWAAGFLIAVSLAPEAWAPRFDTEPTAALLAPIAALGSEDSPLADAAPAERDAASRAIPDAVLALHTALASPRGKP